MAPVDGLSMSRQQLIDAISLSDTPVEGVDEWTDDELNAYAKHYDLGGVHESFEKFVKGFLDTPDDFD